MSDLIKKIKIKKQDGTFTDYIPIGAEAQNVSTKDGLSVENKLNKKPYYFNTVADMKADIKLIEGNMAITLGYYEVNDGGGAEYNIIKDNTLVDDGGSIHDLNNGLKALLIVKNNIVNVKQFGAKGDGIADDSDYFNNAFEYCNKKNSSLSCVQATYYIKNTITIVKNTNKTAQLIIDFNQSTLITDQPIVMLKITSIGSDTSKNWANAWRLTIQNVTLIGSRNSNMNTLTGIKIDEAQGYCLNNFFISSCQNGLEINNTYYGATYGHNIIHNCINGMLFTGGENNGQNFKNIWICGGKYISNNSIGIKINSGGYALEFQNVTIETYNWPISNVDYEGWADLNVKFDSCYFEQNSEGIANLSLTHGVNYIIFTNCHTNETKNLYNNPAFVLGRGRFEIKNNHFKDNIVYINQLGTTVITDLDVKMLENLYNHQSIHIEKINSSYSANITDINNTYVSDSQMNNNAISKFTPIYNYPNQSIYFTKGNTIVLTAPNNKRYRLVVDENGTVATEEISSNLFYSHSKWNSISILDLIEKSPEVSSITITETSLPYVLNINDGEYYGDSIYSKNLKPYGDINYISSYDMGQSPNSWYSIFIYNTDINKWYVRVGSQWNLCTDEIWFATTFNDRAIGTTSQRPVNPKENFIYYDTDLSNYYQYKNNTWVLYNE